MVADNTLFSVPWPLHFEIHFVSPDWGKFCRREYFVGENYVRRKIYLGFKSLRLEFKNCEIQT